MSHEAFIPIINETDNNHVSHFENILTWKLIEDTTILKRVIYIHRLPFAF